MRTADRRKSNAVLFVLKDRETEEKTQTIKMKMRKGGGEVDGEKEKVEGAALEPELEGERKIGEEEYEGGSGEDIVQIKIRTLGKRKK